MTTIHANARITEAGRYHQLRRVLDVLRVAMEVCPSSFDGIAHQFREEVGVDVCDRTLRRDLELLTAVGLLVKRDVPRPGHRRPRIEFELTHHANEIDF